MLHRSGHCAEAAPLYLKTMELCEDGTKGWAESAAAAFDMFKTSECNEVPKPKWWNDGALKALSERAVALTPDHHQTYAMRAVVLQGHALGLVPWKAGPRTAAEIKEAATWYRRAAMLTCIPSERQHYEWLASLCDEYADPLLAKEEADALKARAAADAEATEALKMAEAKATAAAEELLAEEEKETEQASTKAGKAKQGKRKTGKGRR